MTIEEAVSRVRPLDAAAMRAARKRFSDIAMPLGGLGLLQDAIIQLAGIQAQTCTDYSTADCGYFLCG